MSAVIENPIINSPYNEPNRYWQFDEHGLITDVIAPTRRPSESWIPVPTPRKGRGKAVQTELDLEETGERRRRNEQVDQIRERVGLWRQQGYPNVTPTTRRLLEYWSDVERDNRVLFCQREAAETAVFIAEVAPKQGDEWIRNALAEQNREFNDGLARVAFKMATGSGKTVVMAMLIAWQALNKVASPRDARFTRRFLIVTPGVTIRDRLRVLLPADEENYYRQRDLVPADLWGPLRQAEIVITNFHTFLPRATKDGKGVAANTKLLLTAGTSADPFTETPEQVVNRVLREFTGSRASEIVVLNDEAHHCYRGRLAALDADATTEDDLAGDEKREAHSRNADAGVWFSGLRHDSAQLESGEGLKEDFKKIAAAEIEAFKTEQAARTGRPVEELDDATILREVMNTVGRAGRLGEGVRCVVSVSMLTEGWDANTVTHILGVRAFGSQLLCEQVVGRGLRRRSYAVNDDGMFEPEYAEVYGVPFSFIRVSPDSADPRPRRPQTQVRAMEDRSEARIAFPKLDGYRIEIPDGRLTAEFDTDHHFVVPFTIASWTETSGVIGERSQHDLEALDRRRPQEVAYQLAHELLIRFFTDAGDEPRRWLFPDLVRIARQWLDECVTCEPGASIGYLTLGELRQYAAEKIQHGVLAIGGPGDERVTPIFRRYDPEGSTDSVDFFTTKRTMPTDPKKCAVNHVVLDGVDGNTWEQAVAETLESLPQVAAYVKNDHLEFDIPYVHGARTRRYLPDFLVRLAQRDDDVPRHLIVEVSGAFKSHNATMKAMTSSKAETARNLWCAAVNNHGGYGRWGYIEITDPAAARTDLRTAIDLLYTDAPITGLPT